MKYVPHCYIMSRSILIFSKDKYAFPTKEAGAIVWAQERGRSVISLPSVVYNGRTQLREPFKSDIITGLSYELFLSGSNIPEKNITYFGSYQCVEKVPVDWSVMTSLGGGVSTTSRTWKVCFLTRS